MISNFSFLEKEPRYREIATACIEAERSIAISYSAAALHDKAILNDHPFNRDGNIVDIFQGKMEAAKDIVRQIDKLNSKIAISG